MRWPMSQSGLQKEIMRPLVQSAKRVSPFYFTALLQDKLKKFESIITSQQVQIQNTEEMLSFNKVRTKIHSRVAWSPLKKAERNGEK